MAFWFQMNKSIWVSSIVALVFVELLAVVVAAFALHFLSKKVKSARNESRSSSNRHLYAEDSDGTSETFRDSL